MEDLDNEKLMIKNDIKQNVMLLLFSVPSVCCLMSA